MPVGRNVKLIMASEDVIHDFSVPAFRYKMDVVPGHYNTMWFRPTKTGRYHFFCSQYCGTNHALMGGWVTVMEPSDYAAWLSGSSDANANPGRGRRETVCRESLHHLPSWRWQRPRSVAEWASTARKVLLADGSTVTADDAYIRESILAAERQDCGRISAFDAHVPGTIDGGTDFKSYRIHQVFGVAAGSRDGRRNCAGHGEKIVMSSIPPPSGTNCRNEHYLNATYGIRSWLLTTDHKRIALLYLASVTFFFFIGGTFATMIRIHLLTPSGYLVTPETYNKLFTMHGVAMIFFFLIPSIPAVLGNFLIPLMIGAKDLAFPKINLLSWYIYLIGGGFVLVFVLDRRPGYRLDVLYAAEQRVFEFRGHSRGDRHFHQRLLLHPHRPQFHCDHSHHAGARDDLVPFAALRLGALCHQHHLHPGNSGDRHHPCCWPASSACSTSAFSIPRWAAIPSCSSTCSGFTPIRPCTS